MRRLYMSGILALFLVSCASENASVTQPATILSSTPTVTPLLTEIPAPTATPDHKGDPDGDGYPTSYEEAWGTDPQVLTKFDDLKELPGVITGILHTREPYDTEDMNSTIYQQVKIINEEEIFDEENPWNDTGPHKTLTVEFILFPYVAKNVNEYVQSLLLPYVYPEELSEFVEPSTTSDTCPDEKEMMEPIVASSRTLFELGEKIINWNWENLDNDFGWGDDFGQEFRSDIKTSEMMTKGKIGSCMVFATKMVSDFREAKIPAGIAFSYGVAEVNLATHENDLVINLIRTNFHPQNVIWTPRYGWVIFQYFKGFKDTREAPYYVGLIFTDIAVDWNDINSETLFASEKGQGYQWFYYSEELQAPENLLPYLQPNNTYE